MVVGNEAACVAVGEKLLLGINLSGMGEVAAVVGGVVVVLVAVVVVVFLVVVVVGVVVPPLPCNRCVLIGGIGP